MVEKLTIELEILRIGAKGEFDREVFRTAMANYLGFQSITLKSLVSFSLE